MYDFKPRTLDLPDAQVFLTKTFLLSGEADRLFHEFLATTAWRQEWVTMYGKKVAKPRLTAWHGDADAGYASAGDVTRPLPWTPALREVRGLVEAATATTFNGVALNRYDSGADSYAWHSDDRPEFGAEPVVAVVSLGFARTCQFKHRARPDLRASVALTDGSLLVMRGATQRHWLHRIPKTGQRVTEHVNLTFRLST